MIEIIAFKTDCGKVYQQKYSAKEHEKRCRCWKNPKFKTCLSCKFGHKTFDESVGCQNSEMDMDIHFNAAHKNAPNLNINCILWEPKK